MSHQDESRPSELRFGGEPCTGFPRQAGKQLCRLVVQGVPVAPSNPRACQAGSAARWWSSERRARSALPGRVSGRADPPGIDCFRSAHRYGRHPRRVTRRLPASARSHRLCAVSGTPTCGPGAPTAGSGEPAELPKVPGRDQQPVDVLGRHTTLVRRLVQRPREGSEVISHVAGRAIQDRGHTKGEERPRSYGPRRPRRRDGGTVIRDGRPATEPAREHPLPSAPRCTPERWLSFFGGRLRTSLGALMRIARIGVQSSPADGRGPAGCGGGLRYKRLGVPCPDPLRWR